MRTSAGLPGRSRLLDELARLVEDPVARLIALTGPAGVGKSRLLEALEERLAPDLLVLRHTCGGQDASRGGAVGGLLERMGCQLTPSRLLALHEEPGLRRLFALNPLHAGRGDEGEPAAFQFIPLLESLVTLLARLSAERPLLLALDDLQHIDETSRSLLEGLFAHPALDDLNVKLLISCRDLDALPFAVEWQRLLGPMPGLVRLAVEPLDDEGLRELVAHELDASAPDALGGFLAKLGEESGGLPFLALLMLRQARRSGLVRATLSGWRAAEPHALGGGQRAELVDGMLAPLLDRLPLARFLLTWLREAGGPVTLDVLERIAPEALPGWEELARELHLQGVLQRQGDEDGRVRWSFAHALWVELASPWLSPEERKDLLERVAAALDAGDPVERLLLARLLGRLAGDGQADPERAKAALAALMGLLEDGSLDPGQRAQVAEDLLPLCADPLDYARCVAAGIQVALELNSASAVEHWLGRADLDRMAGPERVVALRHLPRRFALSGRSADLLPWIEAVEARGDLTDPERASLLLTRLQRRHVSGDWEGADQEFDRLAALERLPDQAAWAQVLRILAGLDGHGSSEAQFDALEALLRSSGSLFGDAQRLEVMHEMHGLAHLFAGQPRMKAWNEEMVETARRLGSLSVASHRAQLARTLVLAARYGEAEKILRENLAGFLRRRQWVPAAETAMYLVSLLRRMRRLDECAEIHAQAGEVLRQPLPDYLSHSLRLTFCSILWRLHRTSEADQLLGEIERSLSGVRVRELLLALGYCRANIRVQQAETGGDLDRAVEACASMLDLYRELGRSDTEMLLFAAQRDLLLTWRDGAHPSRRAADYLPAAHAARERREYDLGRFLAVLGELALENGEQETLAELLDLVAGQPDQPEFGTLRAAIARGQGKLEEAGGALLETACLLAASTRSGYLEHLSARWPELRAWPPVRPWKPREAAAWAWALRQTVPQGRLPRVPGLVVDAESPQVFVREQLAGLRADAAGFTPAERERLEEELQTLDGWLAAQDDRQGRGGLRLHVLGPVRLTLDGQELDPATLKTRIGVELLALLAIRAWQGRDRLGRDEILDSLTMEGRPLLSESSLRVVISRLRRALQPVCPEAIRFQERQGYLLAEELGLAVDALEFERAWAKAQEAQRGGRSHEAERLLDQCLGLYRGSFLPGGASWTDPLRGYFERRFMEAVRQRAASLDGQGGLRTEFLARLRARLPELAEFLAEDARPAGRR